MLYTSKLNINNLLHQIRKEKNKNKHPRNLRIFKKVANLDDLLYDNFLLYFKKNLPKKIFDKFFDFSK